MEWFSADVPDNRRIIQLLTVILVAAWVWQYLGGVAVRPTHVSAEFARPVMTFPTHDEGPEMHDAYV